MKNTITLLIVLFIATAGFSQKQRATVYFNNGESVQGLAKIKSNGKIKFRKDRKSKKKKYSYEEVDKFDINEGGSITHYQYKRLEGKKKFRLMEIVTEGKMNLYKISQSGSTYSGMGAGGMGMGYSTSYNINNYFLGEAGSREVKKFTSTGTLFSRNFRKAASELFADCPSLVAQIEDKTLRKNDLEEIVKIYNTECD